MLIAASHGVPNPVPSTMLLRLAVARWPGLPMLAGIVPLCLTTLRGCIRFLLIYLPCLGPLLIAVGLPSPRPTITLAWPGGLPPPIMPLPLPPIAVVAISRSCLILVDRIVPHSSAAASLLRDTNAKNGLLHPGQNAWQHTPECLFTTNQEPLRCENTTDMQDRQLACTTTHTCSDQQPQATHLFRSTASSNFHTECPILLRAGKFYLVSNLLLFGRVLHSCWCSCELQTVSEQLWQANAEDQLAGHMLVPAHLQGTD